METKSFAILLVVLCTALTAIGGLFLKLSMMGFTFSILGLITNYKLFIGLASYALGLVILTYSFRHGELSVLFPIVSLTYIWGLVLSVVILNEVISYPEIIGVLLLLGGVSAIGKGSKTRNKIKLRGKK